MIQTNDEPRPSRTLKDYLSISVRGFCMGAADVVPGVSGGTMAFILGIYDELLQAISAVNLDFVRKILTLKWRDAFASFPWKFLLALGVGILGAIFTLAKGLSYVLHYHPEYVWAFFFGLVLASISLVRKRVQKWSPTLIIIAALVALALYWLIGISPVETPNNPVFLFFSGFIAICAMILPGISGAFILVLLGKYTFILNAIISLDILNLAIFAVGCVAGLLSFVRILRNLLSTHHDVTITVLMGMMIGSLRKVWPWKDTLPADATGYVQEALALPSSLTTEVIIAISLMLLGILVIAGLNIQSNRTANKENQLINSPE